MTTKYHLSISDVAEWQVRRLPGHVRQRARRVINGLAVTPRPSNAKELRGRPGRYRIRLEDWRVIYRIDDEFQVVYILEVPRKTGPETYEGIENGD